MPTKILTDIVLSEFVELALGHTASHVNVSPSLARKIEQSDYDHSTVHIEWPSDVNKLTRPRMWRITDWRASLERESRIKEESTKSRAVWVRVSELRQKLIRRLQLATGLEEQFTEQLVSHALKSRNKDTFAVYGIDIADLLAADEELSQFKKRYEYRRETQT